MDHHDLEAGNLPALNRKQIVALHWRWEHRRRARPIGTHAVAVSIGAVEVFPDYGKRARSTFVRWNFPEELADGLLDGLRKPGLEGLD